MIAFLCMTLAIEGLLYALLPSRRKLSRRGRWA